MGCSLTAAECFRKHVLANERVSGLRPGKDGWYSIRCPGRKHGPPLRMRAGDSFHIFYTDLAKPSCPEYEVFAGLIGMGIPGECLKRPVGGTGPPRKHGTEQDIKLADTILDLAFGEGSATERLIRIAMLAADSELPNGPIVDVFAANLRVSPASIYRATAEARRKERDW
jgi:hypothetical protein